MEFRILGPLEVLEEGRPVALGGGKPRALLAVLLLHPNEALTTDRLIEELWGERAPPTAAKAVYVHVSRLRKALAAGAADGAPARACWSRASVATSCGSIPSGSTRNRFERLVAEGRGELAEGRPQRALAALEEALSLWRGEPLADLAYEPFAQPEIARLADLRVGALELLVEAKLALGRHAEVITQLEALIGDHPYRERLRGAADAGALPLRPPGRRARGLPGRAPGAGRGAGDRAGRAPARARAGDTGAGPGARGAGLATWSWRVSPTRGTARVWRPRRRACPRGWSRSC